MQSPEFNEALETLVREDPRYSRDAYLFLRDALEATLKRRKKIRKESQPSTNHVSAAELLEGFRLHALQEFGPMTVTVLAYWGVRSCEDVGHLVFNLVGCGVFGKTDEDSIDGFRGGYDFEEAFLRPFRPEKPILSRSLGGAVKDSQ
jgi:uncharacterized repeat protein (TIGR04138 family)